MNGVRTVDVTNGEEKYVSAIVDTARQGDDISAETWETRLLVAGGPQPLPKPTDTAWKAADQITVLAPGSVRVSRWVDSDTPKGTYLLSVRASGTGEKIILPLTGPRDELVRVV